MKVWKLVAGIISIVLSAFVIFQSCAAGVANTLQESSDVSGSAGMLVAILMLVGGIVSIVVGNGGKAGNIALVVIFGLAALIGFALHGTYSDLVIWAGWCMINVVLAIVAIMKARPGNDTPKPEEQAGE